MFFLAWAESPDSDRPSNGARAHPNIAKVLDAGSRETGRPYLVMELVKGVPINQYCDKNHLPTKERLQLFIAVCQAIHHAHQKGVIHRDIKPSNILVTLHDGRPVPKVIDFGIAKATNQKLTERTLFTHFAQMIGTPAYMSPEQAEMSAKQREVELRRLAEAERDRSQRFLYIANMNLAKRAWDEANLRRVVELLDLHRPQPGRPDLRNFEWFYLDRLCHSELLTLKGHTGYVSSVAFSPDGKRLASGGADQTVKLWDARPRSQEGIPEAKTR